MFWIGLRFIRVVATIYYVWENLKSFQTKSLFKFYSKQTWKILMFYQIRKTLENILLPNNMFFTLEDLGKMNLKEWKSICNNVFYILHLSSSMNFAIFYHNILLKLTVICITNVHIIIKLFTTVFVIFHLIPCW